MLIRSVLLLTILLIFALCLPAQDSIVVSKKYIDGVSERSSKLEKKLDKETARALRQLQRQEEKIKNKLARVDRAKATAILGNTKEKYAALQKSLQNKTSLQQYIPSLDTLGSSLKFLQGNKNLLPAGSAEKLNKALANVNGLEDKFQQAENVQQFIKERQHYLKEQLGQLGLAKELKQLNKEAYYYGQQINEYKSLLRDRKRAERKALELLSKTSLFKDFMQKNSMLARLFSVPSNYNSPQSLVGLQTRAQVQQTVSQQLGTSPINGQSPGQYVQGQMQQAQQQLNQLKDKINSLGLTGESGDMVMPEFKPNSQRTKSFLKRLEYGFDIQNQRGTQLLPVTSDFATTIGYKLDDKSSVGIGASYKMGWGSGLRHMKITNQGVGLRSYLDIKLKGSFWISGGYELNYMKEFEKLTDITNPDVWQKSALLGISKRYRISKNKQANMQLLYDFLAMQQFPQGQRLKFRIGYRF